MWRAVATFAFGMFAVGSAEAEPFFVDSDAGNNNFVAVFDAPLGERITAMSSKLACDVTFDEKTSTMSGSCSVPLTAIQVDGEPTKTEHFQQWTTNKKSDPAACKFEARFSGVKLDLTTSQPAKFTADVPFTVCGRTRSDHGNEHLDGTAVLFQAGSYGTAKTIRVRAHIDHFSRDKYQIGPKYTDGWLARVQRLANVVADEGSIDLSLFAKSKAQ